MTSRVFIYEFFCGGGRYLLKESESDAALLREGAAMLAAICADLAAVAGVSVCSLWDRRIQDVDPPQATRHLVRNADDHDRAFLAQVRQADAVLLIAPEFDHALLHHVEVVEREGVRLLGPGRQFVSLTSDKCLTANHLQQRSVPVPPTYRCVTVADFPPPGDTSFWLLKPVDGAGSEGVRVGTHAELQTWMRSQNGVKCLQPLVEGRSASVAAICRGSDFELLPPMWQRLDPQTFAYQGGEIVADVQDAMRAKHLARLTLQALPPTTGYVGIDLILGASEAADVVIEVNPRLTSSYLGLRQLCQSNLAQAMMDAAEGREPHLSFDRQPLEFSV